MTCRTYLFSLFGFNFSLTVVGVCDFLPNEELLHMKVISLLLTRKTDKHTVLAQRVEYFVLFYYSHKSWTIFKTRVSFEMCRS